MSVLDLAVVGGGTAGLVAAVGAAGLGARVALIEREELGGECLHTGCVPTKALLWAARAAAAVRDAGRFGVRVPPGTTIDPAGVWEHMQSSMLQAGRADSAERMRGLGIAVIAGSARFVAPRRLEVGGRELVARAVLIATGSHTRVPDVPGLPDSRYWTHVDAVSAGEIPRSLCIAGGGPIGVEFALAFARLGSRVTLLQSNRRLLPHEDPELSELIAGVLQAEGVTVRTQVRLTAAGPGWLEEGGRRHSADRILLATGREATLEGLDLGAAGVRVDGQGVQVDRSLRTTAAGVFAAGDVHGHLRFTHVAAHEARAVVSNALFGLHRGIDSRRVPAVTYTDPEVGHVGLGEEEARRLHGDRVKVYRHAASHLDRAICEGETVGLVKLVADPAGRILGAHCIGPRAGELIAELSVAMRAGSRVGDLAQVIHAYPTHAEAVAQTAGEYWRERLFAGWLGRTTRWWLARRH